MCFGPYTGYTDIQALADIPPARAGWVLFADQDVLCDEMGFKMPFTKYEGKDLVLWGSAKLVREDAYQKLLSVSHKDRQQGLCSCRASMQHTSRNHPLVHAEH